MEALHLLNIVTHVTAGSIALIIGFAAVFTSKQNKKHNRLGWRFAWMMAIVIITGLIGVFVFKRNNFLLVITLLSGYNCFSGIRAMRLRGRQLMPIDYIFALLVMASAVYYLYYVLSSGLYWAPVLIYSTIGTLFLVVTYDLFKWVMPARVRAGAAIYEHVYKMISALSGLSSAFTGTVFPQYQPYSQFLPSAIGLVAIIAIFIALGTTKVSLKNTIALK